MASASHCAAASSRLLLGLQRSTSTPKAAIPTITASGLGPKLSPLSISISSNLRSSAAVRLQMRGKVSAVFASNPSGGNSVGKRSADGPQGPPLLTILAGATVFFLIFWLARSIVTGLIGFLVSLIPFK